MARFVFTLAVVLKQKADAEQVAQRGVAVARQALVTAEEELADLDRQRRTADDDMRARLVGPIDVAFIGGHRRFVVAMEQRALQLARRIAEARVAVDKAQAVLIAAARERKALELLEGKQHERWVEAQTKKENADLDEAGMRIAFDHLAGGER